MPDPQIEVKGSTEKKGHIQGSSFLRLVCSRREQKKEGWLGGGGIETYTSSRLWSQWQGTLLEIFYSPTSLFPGFSDLISLLSFCTKLLISPLFCLFLPNVLRFQFHLRIPPSLTLSLFRSCPSLCIIEIPVICTFYSMLSYSLNSRPTFVLPLLWSSHFLTQPWTSSLPPYNDPKQTCALKNTYTIANIVQYNKINNKI